MLIFYGLLKDIDIFYLSNVSLIGFAYYDYHQKKN